MRQFLIVFLVLACLAMAGSARGEAAAAAPRVMGEEIFALLIKGYNDLSQSKFAAAQKEFENVIKADFDNPYANNNLAVIMEKQGRLTDAMTYLHIGEKLADQYVYCLETSYLLGGVCAAVNPDQTTAQTSMIAQVIGANKKKLAEKMGTNSGETSNISAK